MLQSATKHVLGAWSIGLNDPDGKRFFINDADGLYIYILFLDCGYLFTMIMITIGLIDTILWFCGVHLLYFFPFLENEMVGALNLYVVICFVCLFVNGISMPKLSSVLSSSSSPIADAGGYAFELDGGKKSDRYDAIQYMYDTILRCQPRPPPVS